MPLLCGFALNFIDLVVMYDDQSLRFRQGGDTLAEVWCAGDFDWLFDITGIDQQSG